MGEAVGDTIVIYVGRHELRGCLELVDGIAHGDAVPCRNEHGEVVDAIAKCVGILQRYTQGGRDAPHRIAFVGTDDRNVGAWVRAMRVDQAFVAQGACGALAMCGVVKVDVEVIGMNARRVLQAGKVPQLQHRLGD